jgi:tRNA(Arg) A34 adenosine deaminase TadA
MPDVENRMSRNGMSFTLPEWLTARVAGARRLGGRDARMRFAIRLSRDNVAQRTGGPFGAVIVEAATGVPLSAGVNLVEHQGNSVLHAEIVAIMLAQRALGTYTLARSGLPRYELITSSAPCAMCLGAILWSGVSRLVCGARTQDVRAIGFDEGPVFPESFAYLKRRGIEVVRDVQRAEARTVLEEYAKQGGKIYNR